MDVINSIKLSSGTIVKLPIFPAVHVPVLADEYQYTMLLDNLFYVITGYQTLM